MKFRVVLVERVAWTDYPSSWYWRLMSAGNNKTLAHSETYASRDDAFHTARELANSLGVYLERSVDR